MTVTTTERRAADLDERSDDAKERLDELRARRQSLALDAIGDDDAAARKLKTVERQLAGAEAEVERLELASAERERRETEALAAAERKRRLDAVAAARDLQPQRQKAARAVDRAARAFAKAIREYVDVGYAQQRHFREADMNAAARAARVQPLRIEAALTVAIFEAGGVGPVLERLPMIPPSHRRPLAETDVDLSGYEAPDEADSGET